MNQISQQKWSTEELVHELVKHKKAYYSGSPLISDYDYDHIEELLRAQNPDHPFFTMVGSDALDEKTAKAEHNPPMLSLDKTYSLPDLLDWMGDRKAVGTYKIDGNSLSLIYEQNELTIAKTRGNGKFGEDVTAKVRWVGDCPKKTKHNLSTQVQETLRPTNFEVRGELFCRMDAFAQLSKEMKQLGLEIPTSPRNIIAGVLGRKQHIDLARYFSFYAFDLIPKDEGVGFASETEKYRCLNDLGFKTPPLSELASAKEVESFLATVLSFIDEEQYLVDGAVLTFDDNSLHEEMGNTAHHPKYRIAFKWQGETAQAKIKKIIWNPSRLGIVTPVAVIEPVYLSEARITNVTLHNASYVLNYELKAGDTIEIVRSGEVIPKFLQVVEKSEGSAALPENCPNCHTKLIFDEVRLICNNGSCPSKIIGKILNWIRWVEIDDLSEKRLAPLIELGHVQTISDLYRLTEEMLLQVPLVKEKMAKKLLAAIEKSKQVSLPRFLCGLGIQGMGISNWELLLRNYPSLQEVLTVGVQDIANIKGFAEKTAQAVVQGLEENRELIAALHEIGVDPRWQQSSSAQKYEGQTFVITGSFRRSRTEMTQMLKKAGAKVSSSVSKNTMALVISDIDSTSSKAKKAKELNIPLWSEEDFDKNLAAD